MNELKLKGKYFGSGYFCYSCIDGALNGLNNNVFADLGIYGYVDINGQEYRICDLSFALCEVEYYGRRYGNYKIEAQRMKITKILGIYKKYQNRVKKIHWSKLNKNDTNVFLMDYKL